MRKALIIELKRFLKRSETKMAMFEPTTDMAQNAEFKECSKILIQVKKALADLQNSEKKSKPAKKGKPVNSVPEIKITQRGDSSGNGVKRYTVSFNHAAFALFPKKEVVLDKNASGLFFRKPTMMDNTTKKLQHYSISYISSQSDIDLSGKYVLEQSPSDSEVFIAKLLSLEDGMGAIGPNRTSLEGGKYAERADGYM